MLFQDRRIYTLGLGERELKPFLSLVQQSGIRAVLDIRARPESAQPAHFAMEALRQSLDDMGIAYHWAGRHLGAVHAPRPDSVHAALADPLLRGFADHMQSRECLTAMRQLQNLARSTPCVILAAELMPERCHRRLIADQLVLAGWTVLHLLDTTTPREHVLSSEARRESVELVYDRRRT